MSAKLGETPTRACTVCKHSSDVMEEFVKDKGSKYGRKNLCQKCAIIRNNKHIKKKDWKTDHQTRKRYGIDVVTYKQRMLTSDRCEVCAATTELCYDHDHGTMMFRGILCRACNRSIGQLGDSVEGLEKALNYLRKAADYVETH